MSHRTIHLLSYCIWFFEHIVVILWDFSISICPRHWHTHTHTRDINANCTWQNVCVCIYLLITYMYVIANNSDCCHLHSQYAAQITQQTNYTFQTNGVAWCVCCSRPPSKDYLPNGADWRCLITLSSWSVFRCSARNNRSMNGPHICIIILIRCWYNSNDFSLSLHIQRSVFSHAVCTKSNSLDVKWWPKCCIVWHTTNM